MIEIDEKEAVGRGKSIPEEEILRIREARKRLMQPSTRPLIMDHSHQHQEQQQNSRQQAIGLNVNIQHEISTRDDKAEAKFNSAVFDKKGFIEAVVDRSEIKLPADLEKELKHQDLKTSNYKQRLGSLWDNWLGNINLILLPRNYPHIVKNSFVEKLTKNVIEKILDNYQQFYGGIDFYHLPEGFILRNKILDFSPLLATKTDFSSEYKVQIQLADEKKNQKEDDAEHIAERIKKIKDRFFPETKEHKRKKKPKTKRIV